MATRHILQEVCSVMPCSGQTDTDQCYVIKHASVSFVSEIRDLGILIDNNLAMS